MSNILSKLASNTGRVALGLGTLGISELERAMVQRNSDISNKRTNEALRVLAGEGIPAYARVGGSMEMTPEQIRQNKVKQLLAQGTPQAQQALQNLIPKPISPIEQRKLALEERKVGLQEKGITQEEKLAERKQSLAERQYELDVKKLDKELKSGGLSDKDVFDRAQKLRGEFTKLSGDYIKQRDAFGKIEAASKLDTGAGDIALIFSFMKVNDPTSTVREGEFATAQNATGVPEGIRAKYNQILSGERLTPKGRKELVGAAKSLFKDAETKHQKRIGQYTGLATRAGLSPQDVVIDLTSAAGGKVIDFSELPK